MYSYIVVDDETIIRQGLIKKIQKLGMPLECKGQAANGIEGLRLVREANPDIIITDMKMPEMNGVDFLDQISSLYPEKKVIVLSSYKNFEYMSTAIESGVVGYVLKPFSADEIQKQLKKAIDRIDQQNRINEQVGSMKEHLGVFENRLNNQKLLNVILHPQETILPDSQELEKLATVKKFLLIVVKTANPALLPQLEDLCRKGVNGINAMPLEDVTKKYNYFVLFMDHTGHELALETYANAFAQKLREVNGNYEQYICVSNICSSIAEIHSQYKSCMDRFTGLRLSDRQCILKPHKHSVQRVHTDEQIKDIFVNMRYTPDMVSSLLESFFDELAAADATYEVLYLECGSLLRLVNEYGAQNGIETEDFMNVFYDRYLLEIDIERIKREISGYVGLVFSSVQQAGQSQERLMENIKQYIDENYGSRITLEFIASKFFINPTYCSYLFKLKTQENFSEYITRIRVEKAVKLLTETNLSIEYISREVGYKNPKYFFKIFKKYKGFTPAEYRNREQR